MGRRLLHLVAVLDALATLAALVLAALGRLPDDVSRALTAATIALAVVVGLLMAAGMVLLGLCIAAQLQPPYQGRR